MIKRSYGFSLIELVAFIVIVGIIASGSLIAMQQTLLFSAQPGQLLKASQLAKARMTIILYTRRQNGYAAVADPCSQATPPAACTPLINYATNQNMTVTSSIVDNTSNKTATVSIAGTATTQLISRFTNYD